MKTKKGKIIIYAGMVAVSLILLISFIVLKEDAAHSITVAGNDLQHTLKFVC